MSAFLWKLVVDLDIVCKHIFLKPAFGPVFGFIATYHLHFFLPPCYQHFTSALQMHKRAFSHLLSNIQRHTFGTLSLNLVYFDKMDLIDNQKDSMQFLVMYD